MIKKKYRLLSLVLMAVIFIGCLSYSAFEVVAEQNAADSSGFWSEINEEVNQSIIENDVDSVTALLNTLSVVSAIDENYLNVVLMAGESYNALPISEKNRISADSVRLLKDEYIRAGSVVAVQVDSLPSIGEVYLFADNNEKTMEKVLKLSYYSQRFPHDIQKTLPIDKLSLLEEKLTRVVYADSWIVDNARIVQEFSTDQGTEQALTALEAYQHLGTETDLLSSEAVEKLSSAIGNMVYSNTSFDNSNFCLMFTAEDLSKDTAPTINVSAEKLNLNQKQINGYKSALKPNTVLGDVNKLRVIASGEEVTGVDAPIAVTIPISPSNSKRNPYVIAYDDLGNASVLYDTDDNDNTITVMMSNLSGEYAVAYDANITSDKEMSNSESNSVNNSNNNNSNSNTSSGRGNSSADIASSTPYGGVGTSSNSTSDDNTSDDVVSNTSSIPIGNSSTLDTSSVPTDRADTSDEGTSSNATSSVGSDKVSSAVPSQNADSSSEIEKEGNISSNQADGKPTLENMPVKLEHNNRIVLIFVLIGAIALLVGILVIMFIPNSGVRNAITNMINKKKK